MSLSLYLFGGNLTFGKKKSLKQLVLECHLLKTYCNSTYMSYTSCEKTAFLCLFFLFLNERWFSNISPDKIKVK